MWKQTPEGWVWVRVPIRFPVPRLPLRFKQEIPA